MVVKNKHEAEQTSERSTKSFLAYLPYLPSYSIVGFVIILVVLYVNMNISIRSKTDNIGKMRLMTERALKEAFINENGSMSLGFEPRIRLDELQSHFHELYDSGVLELFEALPFLDEFSKTFNQYCSSSQANANDFAHLDEKGRRLVQAIDNINYEMRQTNITHFWLFWTSTAVFGMFLIVAYLYDLKFKESKKIFAREMLENDLKRAKQENEASQLTLSQVCHEMRGHMAVVVMALDTALDEARKADKKDLIVSLEYGTLAAAEQSNVLQNRMEMHKLLSGKFVPSREPIDAVMLTIDIMKRRGAGISGIDLNFDCAYENLWIYLDIYLVDRVINNLLSNALKNTSEGSITVSLSITEGHSSGMDSPSSEVSHVPDEEVTLEIRVRDTGIGIDPSRHNTIFNQGNFIVDRRGTGLGLPFVRNIAINLGGDVSIEESILGKGSCFLVRLPSNKVNRPDGNVSKKEGSYSIQKINSRNDILTTPGPCPTGSPKGSSQLELAARCELLSDESSLPRNLTCILADDQRIIRVMMKKRLSKVAQGLNWTFLEATNGEQTIAMVKEHEMKIDLITMDENMEGEGGRLKGTDTIINLRSCLNFKGVIIGLSGDQEASERQLEAGANFSWGKPLPSEAIMFENLSSALS